MTERLISVERQGDAWALHDKGAPLLTPKKNPLLLPTQALAEAVAAEWRTGARFSTQAMPLSALSFSAIDIIPAHAGRMVEAMLAYAETDLLFYRSEQHELQQRQAAGWDGVLEWIRRRYDCALCVTEGVMPLAQPEETMLRFRAVLQAMDAFALAGFSSLTQLLGSLALALAVREKHLKSEHAFRLSRIDEDFQAEKWGEDSVSIARAREIARDVAAAERFLGLLVA